MLRWEQVRPVRSFPPWTPAFAGVMSREGIPDRSPEHAFIVIAHPDFRLHTKMLEPGVAVFLRRIHTGDSAMPRPDPSGGQAPALHFPIPGPLDSGLRRNDEWGA